MEALLIIITLILLTMLGLFLYSIIKKNNRKRRKRNEDSVADMLKNNDVSLDGVPLTKTQKNSVKPNHTFMGNSPIRVLQNKYCDYEDAFTTSVDPTIVKDPRYIDYYSTECGCGADRPCWKVKIFDNGDFCSERCDKYHEKIKNYS